jgi:hypothetical protein
MKGDVTCAYLGYSIAAIRKQLTGTASLVEKMSGDSATVTLNQFYTQEVKKLLTVPTDKLTNCRPLSAKILSRDRVTIDGGFDWKSDLLNSQITCYYTLQITISHRLVFAVTVFTALLGSGFQRRTFHFLWVPELYPA